MQFLRRSGLTLAFRSTALSTVRHRGASASVRYAFGDRFPVVSGIRPSQIVSTFSTDTKADTEEYLNELGSKEEEKYDDFALPKSSEELYCKEPEEKTGVAKWLPILATQGPKVALVVGGSVLLTKSFLYVTTNLLNITLTDAVWFGVFSGCGMTTLVAGSALAYYRTFESVRPEPVYNKAMELIKKDNAVISALGPFTLSSLASGLFRAYKLDGGDWGLGPGARGFSVPTGMGPDKKLVYRWPRIQMNFQLYGTKHQGMCTVEAINKKGSIKLNLVAVDVLTDDNISEPILVYGEETRLYIRDQLSGFVSFKHKYL
jgi:hypothetical protein